MANNLITDRGMICFGSLLNLKPDLNISLLHIGGNNQIKNLKTFFNALQLNQNLKILYLNDINLDSLNYLSRMLRKNKTLEHLNLMNCGITDIKKISDGLKFN
jgi:hypothetical protein